MWDMSHSSVYITHITHSYVWHNSFKWDIQMGHVSSGSVTCLISVTSMTHSYVWHDSFAVRAMRRSAAHVWHDSVIYMTWLIHMWDMTHSYVRHDSFICGTWLIHLWDMTRSSTWHDSIVCVTWLIHMWDRTHSYVWHDSFIYGTWLIHMCDMTHSYVGHDAFVCVTWLIHMCDMTHSYVCHDSFVHMTWLNRMYDMTHSYLRHTSFAVRTIWRSAAHIATHRRQCSRPATATCCPDRPLRPVAGNTHTLQHTAPHCNALQLHLAALGGYSSCRQHWHNTPPLDCFYNREALPPKHPKQATLTQCLMFRFLLEPQTLTP